MGNLTLSRSWGGRRGETGKERGGSLSNCPIRHDDFLEAGVLPDVLFFTLEVWDAFAIMKSKVVPQMELRLRLVAQIAIYWEETEQGSGTGAVGPSRGHIFDRLEYLTPTGKTQIVSLAKDIKALSPAFVAKLGEL